MITKIINFSLVYLIDMSFNFFYCINFTVLIDDIEVLNTEPERFLPDDLNITDSDTRKKTGECLRKFYFGDKQVSKDDLKEYTTVIIIIYIYVYLKLMCLYVADVKRCFLQRRRDVIARYHKRSKFSCNL